MTSPAANARSRPADPVQIQPATPRAYLRQVVADGGRRGVSTGLLLLDTVAAIGFAAGLAQAIVAVPDGIVAMLPWSALAVGAGSARGGIAMLAARSGAHGAHDAKLSLRRRIVAAAIRRAPGTTATTGMLMSAAVDEVDAIDGYVARFLPARGAAAIAPMLVLVATAFASPIAAAILLATLVPFVAAMALAGGAAAEASRRQFVALARLSGLFADRIRGLPVILAYRAETREAAALGGAADDLADRTMAVLRVAFLSSGALEFFAALSVALVAVYAGFNLLGLLPFPVPETLDLGRAFFVLALAPEFYAPMRRLAAAYHDRQAAETAAERLAVVEATPLAPSGIWPATTRAPTIRFEAVAIRYSGANQDGADQDGAEAIAGFSLDVTAGSMVALTGPSGSGKSSVLHALLGLAPLSAGRVLVNRRDLAEGGGIAAIAAWMGQTALILPGTIAHNIALADPTATPARIAEVARIAGLAPMLLARGGLEATIDARGGGLSGGERRRIAFARALLKPASVLLLDEPTAHLDAESERRLIAAIAHARIGRTVIVATHSTRLAAIADGVVRLGASA